MSKVEPKTAFEAGVARFCKEAGLDQDDKEQLMRLLLNPKNEMLPVALKMSGARDEAELIKEAAWGWGGAASGALTGGGLGATIGSIFPVVGTTIGGGIGAGLGGLLGGLMGGGSDQDADGAADAAQPDMQEHYRLFGQFATPLMQQTFGQGGAGGAAFNRAQEYAARQKMHRQLSRQMLRSYGVYGNAMLQPGYNRGGMLGQNINLEALPPEVRPAARMIQQTGQRQQQLYRGFQGNRPGLGVRGSGFGVPRSTAAGSPVSSMPDQQRAGGRTATAAQ